VNLGEEGLFKLTACLFFLGASIDRLFPVVLHKEESFCQLSSKDVVEVVGGTESRTVEIRSAVMDARLHLRAPQRVHLVFYALPHRSRVAAVASSRRHFYRPVAGSPFLWRIFVPVPGDCCFLCSVTTSFKCICIFFRRMG